MKDWVVETPSFEEDLMNNRVVMLNQNGVNRVVEIIKEKDKEIEQSNNIINELEKHLEEELNRLARETSHTYEDSLGKTRFVNEDIYNEIGKIKNKLQELKGSAKE